MKRPPNRFALAALCGVALALSAAVGRAQDLDRFIIRAAVPDSLTNAQLQMIPVGIDGRPPYQSIDRPGLGANLVAVELSRNDATDLQAARPDLIVEIDRQVVTNAPPTTPVPWSPDRIDQRIGADMEFLPAYINPCGAHRPYVYVCDTGVMATHNEFVTQGNRVIFGNTYIPPLLDRTIPALQDPYDHGTAVAACAVGEETGAGRGPAEIVSAVCYPDPGGGGGGGGTFASFAADVIYWSLNEHLLRGLDADPFNDASVLIFASSTVSGPSTVLDNAVEAARLGGMSVVVSAGNLGIDAAGASPAGANGPFGDITLTVAASNKADMKWGMSNYGPRVELFAPGDNVLCASASGINACAPRSGTSFSTGYVGGAAARILSRSPWATPDAVAQILTDLSDPEHGPSGPFPAPPPDEVPKLLYINPTQLARTGMTYLEWTEWRDLPTADAAEDADPDGDGMSNAVEYFLATDPLALDPKTHRPGMTISGTDVHYRFRRASYLTPTAQFEVQFSNNCMDWEAVPADTITRDPLVTDCTIEAAHLLVEIQDSGTHSYVRLAVLSL